MRHDNVVIHSVIRNSDAWSGRRTPKDAKINVSARQLH